MRNAFKSAMWTVLWSVLGSSGLALLGWLGDAQEWAADLANGGEQSVAFPEWSVLGGTMLGAVFGVAMGVIVFFIRWGQNRDLIGGESPAFDRTTKP
jgi:hypothetical protein